MRWLHEYGLISCYDDYDSLPAGVLEDARLLMEAQVMQSEMEARRGVSR